jgi:hypothetical protein
MKAIAVLIAVAAALAFSQAWADEGGGTTGATSGGATTTGALGGTTGVQSTGTGESWRYQRFEGRWWYWMPDNHWVYWDNCRWVSFGARATASAAGQVPYTVGYRGVEEPPAQTYPIPQTEWARPAALGWPGTSFGTHGSAISHGF